MSPRKSFREDILDSAEAVVMEAGPGKLTLDAVSAKAGVSKGGLLYHFPNKESLIEAMIERLTTRFTREREIAAQKIPDGPAREVKAHILTMSGQDRKTKRTMTALLAAAANEPKALRPAREAYRELFQGFEASGLKRNLAAVICLALDGLTIMELLEVSPYDEDQRQGIVEELLRLADVAAAQRDLA